MAARRGGQQRLDGLPQLLGHEVVDGGGHGCGSCPRADRAARTGRRSETRSTSPCLVAPTALLHLAILTQAEAVTAGSVQIAKVSSVIATASRRWLAPPPPPPAGSGRGGGSDEGVSSDHDPGAAVPLEPPRWTKPCFSRPCSAVMAAAGSSGRWREGFRRPAVGCCGGSFQPALNQVLSGQPSADLHAASPGPADRINPAVTAAVDEWGVDLSQEFLNSVTDESSRLPTWSRHG
jgi:hypothetical protein